MSEELKACPFCKSHFSGYVVERSGLEFYQCQNCDARVNSFDDWNTRPIEDALQSEIARLTARVQELAGLLDKANACIGSVVACCTYGSEQSAKTGAYGISLDAFTKIDTYMRTISENNWLPLLPLPDVPAEEE